MPRVKKLSADADSLVAVKKRVNKRNKKKYAAETGAPAVQAVADPSLPLYNGLLTRLQSVVASVGEIRGQLELTNEYFDLRNNKPWARAAIDRFVSVNASVKKGVADLNSFLEQNIRSLNIFSDGQVSNIRKLYEELIEVFQALVVGINRLSPVRQASLQRLFKVFADDLIKLSQTMAGLLGSYKQLPSGAAPDIEAMMYPAARPTGQGLIQDAVAKYAEVKEKGLELLPAPIKRKIKQARETEKLLADNKARILAEDMATGSYGGMLARKPIGSDPRTYSPHPMMGGIYLEIKEMPTRFL